MTNSKKIFIVDDDPDITYFFGRRLKAAGYDVRAFSRGREAVEAAFQDPPDLILMDVLMPDMNGFEACKKFKENPKTSKSHILFLSALSGSADRIEAEKAGGVAYLTKPIDMSELVRVVNKYS